MPDHGPPVRPGADCPAAPLAPCGGRQQEGRSWPGSLVASAPGLPGPRRTTAGNSPGPASSGAGGARRRDGLVRRRLEPEPVRVINEESGLEADGHPMSTQR